MREEDDWLYAREQELPSLQERPALSFFFSSVIVIVVIVTPLLPCCSKTAVSIVPSDALIVFFFFLRGRGSHTLWDSSTELHNENTFEPPPLLFKKKSVSFSRKLNVKVSTFFFFWSFLCKESALPCRIDHGCLRSLKQRCYYHLKRNKQTNKQGNTKRVENSPRKLRLDFSRKVSQLE